MPSKVAASSRLSVRSAGSGDPDPAPSPSRTTATAFSALITVASSLRFAAPHSDTTNSTTAIQTPAARGRTISNGIDPPAVTRRPRPAPRPGYDRRPIPRLYEEPVRDFLSLQGYPGGAASASRV